MLGRFNGVVSKYFVDKKYGFVKIKERTDEDVLDSASSKYIIGEDAFIHFKQIEPLKTCFKKLYCGQTVEFDLVRTNRGLVANNLKITGDIFDEHGEVCGNN